MKRTDKRYNAYMGILKEELLTAMGCTEPIAIAYAAARAREALGFMPDRFEVEASANIIKNVKSVVVPNTEGLKGIEAAAAAGIAAGDADQILEVISSVDDDGRQKIKKLLDTAEINVTQIDSDLIFDLIVRVFKGKENALVRISNHHTNIIRLEKNGKTLFKHKTPRPSHDQTQGLTDRSLLSVEGIVDFAQIVAIDDIEEVLQHQIDCNMKIAHEGMKGNWGANIGSVIIENWEDDIQIRAKAMAAAGSDARMSGCDLPVVIVAGSGNQGITASVPVIEYAKEMKSTKADLFKALAISNLTAIHLKTGIGRLSAYCGAVTAGVSAGAGIAWLHGGRFREIAHTIVNGLATVSGIICDGAKPACAAKIASSVDAGILGFKMVQKGQQFYGGDGIIKKGVENTIKNIARLGREGMRETDKEIIRMMLNECL